MASSSSSSPSMVTTYMPLTTVFTPPARCTDLPYTYWHDIDGTSTFWRDTNGPGEGAMSACYPYSYGYQHVSTVTAEYSPGVCPSGWEAAAVAENGVADAVTSWCCPSGLTYASNYGCETLVTTPTIVALNPSVNISMSTAFLAVDWYIKVAWASSDLSIFSPASAPILTYTGTAASTIAATGSTSSVTVPGSTADISNNLSPGSTATSPATTTSAAISTYTTPAARKPTLGAGVDAGIGVGVAVGVIVLAALAGWLILRRRWRVTRSVEPPDYKAQVYGESDVKLAGNDHSGFQQVYLGELSSNSLPHEADYANVRAEMDGGWRPNELRNTRTFPAK